MTYGIVMSRHRGPVTVARFTRKGGSSTLNFDSLPGTFFDEGFESTIAQELRTYQLSDDLSDATIMAMRNTPGEPNLEGQLFWIEQFPALRLVSFTHKSNLMVNDIYGVFVPDKEAVVRYLQSDHCNSHVELLIEEVYRGLVNLMHLEFLSNERARLINASVATRTETNDTSFDGLSDEDALLKLNSRLSFNSDVSRLRMLKEVENEIQMRMLRMSRTLL